MRLTATRVECSAESRTITGCLFPFGAEASPSSGPSKVVFDAAGSHTLDGRIWLNLDHNPTARVGWTEALEVRDEGIWATWKILATTAGNDALVEAAEGARHAFSVEADIVESEPLGDAELVTASVITGGALTSFPAFESAIVEHVAATETTEESEKKMPELDEKTETETVVLPERVPVAAAIRTSPRVGDIAAAAIRNDVAEYRRMVHAAAPHTLSSDVTGLIPAPILNRLIETVHKESPLFNALGAQSAPASNVFTMPVLSTPLTAAAAAAEKTDVTAQMVITDVTVDMVALKRAVNVSEEALAWSSAGNLLQIIAEQLATAIVRGREAYATTTVEAVTGQNTAVTIAANGSDAWAKVSGAVGTAFKANASAPTFAALTIDTWAKLAGFTNSVGAPLITGMEQNVNGGRGLLFGLPCIVSPTLTKSYLVDGSLAWSFVNADTRATVNEPTILGRSFGIMQGVGVLAMPKSLTQISVAAS